MYRVADVELDATILLGRHLSHHAVTHSAHVGSSHRNTAETRLRYVGKASSSACRHHLLYDLGLDSGYAELL